MDTWLDMEAHTRSILQQPGPLGRVSLHSPHGRIERYRNPQAHAFRDVDTKPHMLTPRCPRSSWAHTDTSTHACTQTQEGVPTRTGISGRTGWNSTDTGSSTQEPEQVAGAWRMQGEKPRVLCSSRPVHSTQRVHCPRPLFSATHPASPQGRLRPSIPILHGSREGWGRKAWLSQERMGRDFPISISLPLCFAQGGAPGAWEARV